ncbi:hypothetical protein SD80_009915 [Scytonema tolypothrichoides VB-61278]|nr:hypothetical protein SD80_009915 [Scytonema tolypothrichoides VB-61278]
MIQRSLQACVEGIKAAKIALIDRFSNNQQKLANALEVSRQPVNKFFNRKPVDSSLFVQICEKLGLKWQEVADFLQSELEESLQNSDIIKIKLDAYHAEVERDWDLARQLWIRVNVAAGGSDMQAICAGKNGV